MGGKKQLYDPAARGPFKLSRTKLEDFIKCARCFYLDLRHGVSKPKWPAFTLNLAVDHLLKKEFDLYRALKDEPAFDGRLRFKLTLLPHTGDGAWVEHALCDAHQCLQLAALPAPAASAEGGSAFGGGCKHCAYRRAAKEREG